MVKPSYAMVTLFYDVLTPLYEVEKSSFVEVRSLSVVVTSFSDVVKPLYEVVRALYVVVTLLRDVVKSFIRCGSIMWKK